MAKIKRHKAARIYMKRGQQIVYAERGIRAYTGRPTHPPGHPSGDCLQTKGFMGDLSECRCGRHNK